MNNRSVALEFDAALDAVKTDESLRDNLSAVLRIDKHLFLASD